MWHSVVRELSGSVNLGFWENPRRSRFRPPPDVWLYDGHQGPLGVPEPTVVHLQEASWRRDDTRPLFDARFIEQFEVPSREAAEQATGIITPSESSRAQILDQYTVDADRVHTVPLGVDLAVFRPGTPGAADIIACAGGDPTRPYVLFVSTVAPRKNLAALKTAMNSLARRGLPHGLVLVVSPPPDRRDPSPLFAEAASDLPDAPDRVVVLGCLSDVELAAVMGAASAFCLPSLMEGFGLTALEAMACGAPVIVSDRGSLPEVVGQAGVVTAPTADALEAALYEVLSSVELAAELSRAGLARSLKFSWKATAEGWLRTLNQAVPEPRLHGLEWLPRPGLSTRAFTDGVRLPVVRRQSARPDRTRRPADALVQVARWAVRHGGSQPG